MTSTETEKPFVPAPSRRIQATPSAIIDDLLEAHPNVRYNLAPGAPRIPPDATAISKAKALLRNTNAVQALSRYDNVVGSSTLRNEWANVLFNPLYNNHIAESNTGKTSQPSPHVAIDRLLPLHDFMVTAGANQAFVNLVVAICDPGDVVLLCLPYYYSHFNALLMTGVHPVLIPCVADTFLPEVQSVADRISPRTRALIVTNPGNPSGVVVPHMLLDALANLCRRRAVYFVLDEAYREYNFTQETPQSTDAPPADDAKPSPPAVYTPRLQPHIIKLYTMSKAYGLAGWRVGAIVYPKTLHTHMRKAQDTIPTHAALFSQAVAEFSLQSVPLHIAVTSRVRDVFLRALNRVYVGSRLEPYYVVPNGAFYAFVPYCRPARAVAQADAEVDAGVDADAGRNADMWAVNRLVEIADVLVVPGFAAGMCGYLRVCYGCVAPGRAEETARVLAEGLRTVIGEFERFVSDTVVTTE